MNIDYPNIQSLTPRERMNYFSEKYGQLCGWMTEQDLLFLCSWLPEVALTYQTPPHILEVGSFLGSTARGLISLTGGLLSAIDNWVDVRPHLKNNETPEDAWWKTLRENGQDLSQYVKSLYGGESAEIGQSWTEPIDMLFIDGDHHYSPASADMGLFVPHLNVGGYLLVDDWNQPEVRLATQDVVLSNVLWQWQMIRIPPITQLASESEKKLWVAQRVK